MTIKIPTPEKMQKFPWATSVVTLFAVCIFLLYLVVKKPACDEESWKLAYQEERSKNDKLTTALIVQKYALDELKSNKDTTKIKNHENIK